MEPLELSIFGIVGKQLCVASKDGEIVFQLVAKAMGEEKRVALSFSNVSLLTSAFLNSAIGQLYGKFSEDTIRQLLSLKDMEPDDRLLLKRVVDNAKLYFADKPRFKSIVREDDNDE